MPPCGRVGSQSYSAIAKEFSRLKVDGSDGWRAKSVKDLLSNPIYIGVDIFNRTRNEFDPETHKRKTIPNPRSEWQIKLVPELRVWTDELWKKIRHRAYAIDEKRRQQKLDVAGLNKGGGSIAGERNADAPTALLSGTLFCKCGQELKLVRSGKHAAMGCFDGRDGLHGCTMNTVKATAIVEKAVLSYLQRYLLTDEALARLVCAANAALEEEAARPRQDSQPHKTELKKLTGQRDKLVGLLLGEDSDQFLQGVKEQIKNLEKRMKQLSMTIADIDRQNQPAPPPLGVQNVLGYMGDLRNVLDQEPAAAAIVLRGLTGKITVNHQRHSRKKGGVWILTFNPTLMPALTDLAGQSPEAATLKHLRVKESMRMPPVTLEVDKRQSLHARLAPQVAQMKDQIDPQTGKPYTIPGIAKTLGYSRDVTYLAWKTARRDVPCKVDPPGSMPPPSTTSERAA